MITLLYGMTGRDNSEILLRENLVLAALRINRTKHMQKVHSVRACERTFTITVVVVHEINKAQVYNVCAFILIEAHVSSVYIQRQLCLRWLRNALWARHIYLSHASALHAIYVQYLIMCSYLLYSG